MIERMDLVHALALIPIGASLVVLVLGIGLAATRGRRRRGRGLTSGKGAATE